MDAPSFSIKSGSSDFLSKQKNIFDLLTLAEQGQEITTRRSSSEEIMETDNDHSRKRKRRETKQFRGKESLFKEPQELPPRFRRHNQVPDYQRNPHRWVKYSLADVTQDDMSNASNTAAALSFLKSVKSDNKRTKVEKMEEGEPSSKESNSLVKFNAPRKFRERKANFGDEPEPVVDEQVQDKPVFKSSKLIMPEYVVGQAKKSKTKKEKQVSMEKGKEIKLDHIQDYEDE